MGRILFRNRWLFLSLFRFYQFLLQFKKKQHKSMYYEQIVINQECCSGLAKSMPCKRRGSYGRFETYPHKNMERTRIKITAIWRQVRLQHRNAASFLRPQHLQHQQSKLDGELLSIEWVDAIDECYTIIQNGIENNKYSSGVGLADKYEAGDERADLWQTEYKREEG